MKRLTARNDKGLAYLVKVKPNEQAVNGDGKRNYYKKYSAG